MTTIEGTLARAFTLIGIKEDLSRHATSGVSIECDVTPWQEIARKLKAKCGGSLIETCQTISLSGFGDVTVTLVIEEEQDWPVRISHLQSEGDTDRFKSLMTLHHWLRALVGEHVIERGFAPKHWVLVNGKGDIVAMS